MVISSTPKCNRHGVGYQPGNQKRNGQMGSQKEDKMVRSNLVFPLLNWTFRSGGYINSSLFGEDENIATPFLALTINVITEYGKMIESTRPTVYPCSPNFELNNWNIMEIPIVHKSSE